MVLVGRWAGGPIWDLVDLKHRWGPPDGDILRAVGWMISRKTDFAHEFIQGT